MPKSNCPLPKSLPFLLPFTTMTSTFKIPISVLVMVFNSRAEFLLLKRVNHHQDFDQDFWQSITGSLDTFDEQPEMAAQRELFEETGLVASQHEWINLRHHIEYEIYPQWRYRYEPGTIKNIEHHFAVKLSDDTTPIHISPSEHTDYIWLPAHLAAEKCFSPSNATAVNHLAKRVEITKN